MQVTPFLNLKNYLFGRTESTEHSAKREALHAEILEFKNLPDDFDGDGGRAPNAKDIENAISVIPYIPNAGIDTVIAMVAGDGDVGFQWGREIDLEIGFSDGEISFFGKMPGGKVIRETKVYDGVVPEGLKELLSVIFPN